MTCFVVDGWSDRFIADCRNENKIALDMLKILLLALQSLTRKQRQHDARSRDLTADHILNELGRVLRNVAPVEVLHLLLLVWRSSSGLNARTAFKRLITQDAAPL